MRYFDWNRDKSVKLLKTRGVSFERVVDLLVMGDILDVVEHPNKKKYPRQKMYIVNIDGYACAVPFVEDEEKIFLKTIFPSRKLTHKYLNR